MTKVALIILDGFGYSEDTAHNAVAMAKTPYIDKLLKTRPHSLLETSGEAVGLPAGVMGNSEVGHLTIGAGRVIYQDLTRIDKFMRTEGFKKLEALNRISAAPSIHLVGLLSDGGVHSHENHLHGLIDFYSQHYPNQQLYIHAFTDGRDTPPKSAINHIEKLEALIANKPNVKISTLVGRFYAMDRDKRWERVKLAYDAMASAVGERAKTAREAVLEAYACGESDEFIKPRVIEGGKTIAADDAVVFFNFRADRAREISMAFAMPTFNEFSTPIKVKEENWVCFSPYSEDFTFPALFVKEDLNDILPELISKQGLQQLRIAETEKYAHVTYFFNGGKEAVLKGEDRILVDSPKEVETYDLKPEMSAYKITDHLVAAIGSEKYDFIACNYANGDMVGHTGVEPAAVLAVETLDQCIQKVCDIALQKGYEVLISADHGNCEEMVDKVSGEPMTQHSTNPVPLIWVGERAQGQRLKNGTLADIAPTVLELMNIQKPDVMSGTSLIHK